jgi:hypothetical protein
MVRENADSNLNTNVLGPIGRVGGQVFGYEEGMRTERIDRRISRKELRDGSRTERGESSSRERREESAPREDSRGDEHSEQHNSERYEGCGCGGSGEAAARGAAARAAEER